MTKDRGGHESSGNKPELTPSQKALKDLADEMLALREEGDESSVIRFRVGLPPSDVEFILKNSSFADLLLQDGASLSENPPNYHYPDLGLYIGLAELRSSEIRAWGLDYDEGWGRHLGIKFWYSNGVQSAGQELTVQTWSYAAGATPRISRNITAEAYAEMGYEGHNAVSRDARGEAEIIEFVDIVRKLFKTDIREV